MTGIDREEIDRDREHGGWLRRSAQWRQAARLRLGGSWREHCASRRVTAGHGGPLRVTALCDWSRRGREVRGGRGGRGGRVEGRASRCAREAKCRASPRQTCPRSSATGTAAACRCRHSPAQATPDRRAHDARRREQLQALRICRHVGYNGL